MPDFDDIRPFNDNEMLPVFRRVINDNEFIDLIGLQQFSPVYAWAKFLMRPLLRFMLTRHLKKLRSIVDFQLIVAQYLEKMIQRTTTHFEVRGLNKLDLTKPHLFMSNHRDIALDPAFTNYALFHDGGTTVRIAIGDNLLSKPYVSDLMRLNKSFIVQRGITKPRELFKALKKLSRYIWHSLKVDKENIWIAHREGRAKDGIDKSEAAIIKMLTIAKPKMVDFADYVKQLNIVPVSIAYELDPCDGMKAKELRALDENQTYVKSEHEDLESIGKGIQGQKGNVTLVFGEPLKDSYSNADEVAQALDRAIVCNYQLQTTNFIAYRLLKGDAKYEQLQSLLTSHNLQTMTSIKENDTTKFKQRLAQIPTADQPFILQMYANPVINLLLTINNC